MHGSVKMNYSIMKISDLIENDLDSLLNAIDRNELEPYELTFAAEFLAHCTQDCKQSSRVVALLFELLSHENKIVREGAIYGLSQYFKNAKCIYEKLNLMSTSDECEIIRGLALELLKDE